MKPWCVIWDWNGTLLDDVSVSYSIFNDMLEAKGFSRITFDKFRALYTHPIIKMYEDVGFQFSDEYSFDDLSREWYEIYSKHPAHPGLFDDVHSALSHLQQSSAHQLIISALHHDALLTQVQAHGLESYFSGISGHHDLRADSKVERAVDFAKSRGVDPARAVVIGDTTHDAEMAREIGCECFLVCRGYETKKKLESTSFPVFEDLFSAVNKITEQ